MTRIDKYLWAVRIVKTRSIGTNLCKDGKILIDDVAVKPSAEVKSGQMISVKKNSAFFSYRVIQVLEKRMAAKSVRDFIKDITPPEELEKFKLYQAAQREYRSGGLGRPTTKDRRAMRLFKGK